MTVALKTLVIINPISGTGKQKDVRFLLEKYLDRKRFHADFRKTECAGHAIELAQDAIKNEYNAIIVVGGDGTINEIASSLSFSDLTMGIIPCGSGNGLARHLGIPMNTKKAIQWLNHANIQKIDTILANNKRFVNVAGIGFDALVAHEFEKMKSRGLYTYAKIVIKCFGKFPNQSFKIQDKNNLFLEHGMMLCFANSSQFGNNAYIAPNAILNDGKMNISLLKKPLWYQVPTLALKIFTKKIHSSKLFKEFITDEINVVQESKLGHIDGEAVFFGKEIHLKVDPKSLCIFC